MELPQYKERSTNDIVHALEWAQTMLQMREWRILGFFDEAVKGVGDLEHTHDSRGGTCLHTGELLALVGIQSALCEEDNIDPIFVAFHEIAHILCWPKYMTEDSDTFKTLWEQVSNRIALVLYELWERTDASSP